jgi:hypothetical protein
MKWEREFVHSAEVQALRIGPQVTVSPVLHAFLVELKKLQQSLN